MGRSMRRRLYHFCYTSGDRLHQLRDGDAFAEILAVLLGGGCEYGGCIRNRVETTSTKQPEGAIPRIRSGDVLVLTTRPPYQEDPTTRKRIAQTGTELERLIFATVGHYFFRLNRTSVVFQKPFGLQGEWKDRSEISFYQYHTPAHGAGDYKSFSDFYGGGRSRAALKSGTLAFLLAAPLLPRGPEVITAFAMSGAMTITWCYLLRTRFREFLRSPRFVVAELPSSRSIPKSPATLAFADDWKVRVLLDVPATAR